MPKEIKDIKDFLAKVRRTDAKQVTIKKSPQTVKFKVRCSKYLYTYKVKNQRDTVSKLMQAMPPSTKKVEINEKGKVVQKK